MYEPSACIGCGAPRLQPEKSFTFVRPSVDPVRDRQRLVDSIRLERLHIFFEEIAAGQDRFTTTVVACRDCGLRFLSPRPTEEELERKYAAIDRLGIVKE